MQSKLADGVSSIALLQSIFTPLSPTLHNTIDFLTAQRPQTASNELISATDEVSFASIIDSIQSGLFLYPHFFSLLDDDIIATFLDSATSIALLPNPPLPLLDGLEPGFSQRYKLPAFPWASPSSSSSSSTNPQQPPDSTTHSISSFLGLLSTPPDDWVLGRRLLSYKDSFTSLNHFFSALSQQLTIHSISAPSLYQRDLIKVKQIFTGVNQAVAAYNLQLTQFEFCLTAAVRITPIPSPSSLQSTISLATETIAPTKEKLSDVQSHHHVDPDTASTSPPVPSPSPQTTQTTQTTTLTSSTRPPLSLLNSNELRTILRANFTTSVPTGFVCFEFRNTNYRWNCEQFSGFSALLDHICDGVGGELDWDAIPSTLNTIYISTLSLDNGNLIQVSGPNAVIDGAHELLAAFCNVDTKQCDQADNRCDCLRCCGAISRSALVEEYYTIKVYWD